MGKRYSILNYMESYKFSFFPTHFKLTQTSTKSPDGPPSYIIEHMESQLSLEKKINIIAFLDDFLELSKFLVFHEATFWIRGFKEASSKTSGRGG